MILFKLKQNIKNNIGFILITVFTILAASLSYFWNCFFLQMLIVKSTPEQIIFYDAKYLTREIEKEKEEDKKRKKALKEEEKKNKKSKKQNKKDLIKDKKTKNQQNKITNKNLSYDFKHNLNLDKNNNLSFANNLENNNIELQMSVDKIYELRKYQHNFNAKFCGLNNYSEIFDSNSKLNSIINSDFDQQGDSFHNHSVPNELKFNDIQLDVPALKGNFYYKLH